MHRHRSTAKMKECRGHIVVLLPPAGRILEMPSVQKSTESPASNRRVSVS
jgi:hypothetical protein